MADGAVLASLAGLHPGQSLLRPPGKALSQRLQAVTMHKRLHSVISLPLKNRQIRPGQREAQSCTADGDQNRGTPWSLKSRCEKWGAAPCCDYSAEPGGNFFSPFAGSSSRFIKWGLWVSGTAPREFVPVSCSTASLNSILTMSFRCSKPTISPAWSSTGMTS